MIIECISSQHYLTKIEDTSQIPPNISKSKLIALPKQPRAREFELPRIRIISFMSHITKILLRILRMRFIHKIRLEHRYTVAYMEGNGAKFLLKLYLIEPRKHWERYSYVSLTTPRHLIKYNLLDLLTYCCFASQFSVCDTLAAFLICGVSSLQHFMSCASSVISARSLLECSLIGCLIGPRSLLNTVGNVVFSSLCSLLQLRIK